MKENKIIHISFLPSDKCNKCSALSIMGTCLLKTVAIPLCKDRTCNLRIINNYKQYKKWKERLSNETNTNVN